MSARGKPGADHMLFYSACQATFYIMCFRGEELAAMDSITNQVSERVRSYQSGFWEGVVNQSGVSHPTIRGGGGKSEQFSNFRGGT